MANGQRANATHGYVDKQDVSLREYLENRIDNLEKTLLERYSTQEKTTANVLSANEKRLDSMNEFRETLRDQNRTFITRTDHESLIASFQKDIDRIDDDIESLKISRAELSGKASQSQLNIHFIFTLVSFVIAVVGLLIKWFGY